MTYNDYHVHSCFCDGKNTPEQIVVSAIGMGMPEIGILTHSYTAFDTSYCIKRESIAAFQREISRLKEKYLGKISILCGVEQDMYSSEPTDGFDYVIGSVHYVQCGKRYYPVDESAEVFIKTVNEQFDGDVYAYADAYFQTAARVAEVTKPDIIGHFDLISKFNEGERLFSERDSHYVDSCRKALDVLLPYNIPFEINTGAISRGYRSSPYPNRDMIEYIKSKGGRLILSSDSHDKSTLCFSFDKYKSVDEDFRRTIASGSKIPEGTLIGRLYG